jgi:hypothetical protein
VSARPDRQHRPAGALEKIRRFFRWRRQRRWLADLGFLGRKSFRPSLHAFHASLARNTKSITVISHPRYLMNVADA